MYITDLTYFLDASGAIGPVKGPPRAMAQFHVDVVAHALGRDFGASSCAAVLQVQEGKCRRRRRQGSCRRLEVSEVPDRGARLELAGQPVGPAGPPGCHQLMRGCHETVVAYVSALS